MPDISPATDCRLEKVLITERQIRARVRALARQIVRDSADCTPLRLVGILKGAFVFMSDLGRDIRKAGGPELRYDFIRARAYDTGVKGAAELGREVRIELFPDDLAGHDVLVVEDILDQGFTLAKIRNLLRDKGARSVRLCVFLVKRLEAPTPAVRTLRQALQPDYVGFEVPDRWVAGYGLDAGQEFRELPYVAIVREEYYRKPQPGRVRPAE